MQTDRDIPQIMTDNALSLWAISQSAFFMIGKDVAPSLVATSYKTPPIVFIPEQWHGTEEILCRT